MGNITAFDKLARISGDEWIIFLNWWLVLIQQAAPKPVREVCPDKTSRLISYYNTSAISSITCKVRTERYRRVLYGACSLPKLFMLYDRCFLRAVLWKFEFTFFACVTYCTSSNDSLLYDQALKGVFFVRGVALGRFLAGCYAMPII